jgi:hypothetical protein
VSIKQTDGGSTIASGPLGQLSYQTYTSDDYNNFKSMYNYGYPAYTVDKYDFLKVNLPSNLVHQSVAPTLQSVALSSNCVLLALTFPQSLVSLAGAPQRVSALYCLQSSVNPSLSLQLILWNKTATRLPESAFFAFFKSLFAMFVDDN